MSRPIIEVEDMSKLYRLGVIGATTLRETFERWWQRRRAVSNAPLVDPDDPRSGPEPDSFWALRHISFTADRGEVVGIIGRNGAGKSTLLKILTRITEPTEGEAVLRGRVASLLEVGTGFHPELTGRENVYLNGAILGMRKDEITRKFDEIVSFAEVERFIDTPVKRYSSGMRVRLAFAVAAHLEPEILLVDEVLAVGDIAFQKKCLGKMQDVAGEGRTVLFVSHNMAMVQKLCSRGVLLVDGRMAVCSSVDVVVDAYRKTMNGADSDGSISSAVIFRRSREDSRHKVEVSKIELLDEDRQPVTLLKTWSPVCFRIHLRSAVRVRRAAVVLTIAHIESKPLILTSTSPDRDLSFSIPDGETYVDCVFPRFPLSCGVYTVGVDVAIPMQEWLFRGNEIARLTVGAQDIFGTGLPPVAERYYVAVEHEWYAAAAPDEG